MRLLIVLFFCLYSLFAVADGNRELNAANRLSAFNSDQEGLKLKDMEFDDAGYLTNTSTDGFFTLQGFDLPRGQACNMLLELEFAEPLSRPAMFELFWSTSPDAYSESQKTRFLVSHKHTLEPTRFILPLCKMYRFSGNINNPNLQRNITGFRFDFPVNRTLSLKISQFRPLSAAELGPLLTDSAKATVFIEPYERIPGKAFTSAGTIVTKVLFALEDGFNRLSGDRWFLCFWLALIFACVILIIRSFPSSVAKK